MNKNDLNTLNIEVSIPLFVSLLAELLKLYPSTQSDVILLIWPHHNS